MLHWLWLHAGLSSASSVWYLFWSGIGADWSRILAFGAFLKFARTLQQHHTERLEQQERHHQERMTSPE